MLSSGAGALVRLLSIIFATATLCGCATNPSPEQVVGLKDGKLSALALNVSGSLECTFVDVYLQREGDAKPIVFPSLRGKGHATSDPWVLLQPPGRYRIVSALCEKSGYVPAVLPYLGDWFTPVDLGAGETVYLGTLNIERHDFATSSAYANPVTRFMLAEDNDRSTTYLTYSIVDHPEFHSWMAANYPDLADKVITRFPTQKVSNQDMIALAKEAFAPDANGVLPTRAVAMAKLSALIKSRTTDR